MLVLKHAHAIQDLYYVASSLIFVSECRSQFFFLSITLHVFLQSHSDTHTPTDIHTHMHSCTPHTHSCAVRTHTQMHTHQAIGLPVADVGVDPSDHLVLGVRYTIMLGVGLTSLPHSLFPPCGMQFPSHTYIWTMAAIQTKGTAR